MKYTYIYQKMVIGGCQLLIQKIASKMVEDGNDVTVLCETVMPMLKQELKEQGINIVELGQGNWLNDKILSNKLKKNNAQNNCIVVFIWVDYIRMKSLCSHNDRVLFYAVHHDAIRRAVSQKGIVGAIHKKMIRNTIRTLIENKHIVLMDEQTFRHTCDYYGYHDLKAQIIRIPIDTENSDLNFCDVAKKYQSKNRIILAVARADFPFKGYLLGLMDLFNSGRIPHNYSLRIVSYGEDYNLLENKYNLLCNKTKKRISLLGQTPYSKLNNLFKDCHLYVGMGTTLLDASRFGVVSIPVVSYTDRVLACGFFHDDYTTLALDDGTEENFIDLVKYFNELDSTKLEEMIKKSREIVTTHYSTETCVNTLYTCFNGMHEIKDVGIRIIYKVRKIIWNMKGTFTHDNAQ